MPIYTTKIAERKVESIEGTSGAHLWVELRVNYSQDIAANKTTATSFKLYLCGTAELYDTADETGARARPWIDWANSTPYYVRCYKQQKNSSTTSWSSYKSDLANLGYYGESVKETELAARTNITITHEVNGSARIWISGGSIGLKHLSNGTEKEVRNWLTFGEVFVELPAIDRNTAILTAYNFNDEESPTITYGETTTGQSILMSSTGRITAYDDNVTELQAAISLDRVTPIIPYRDIVYNGGSYTFNLTEEERETIRENVQGATVKPVYYLIRTARKVESGSLLDEADCITVSQKNITIINCAPVISPAVYDVNEKTKALTGDANVLVKYFSDARAALNAITRKRATLAGYYIQNGNNKQQEPSYTFSAVDYNVFEFYVVDSRNQQKQATLTPSMVDYIKLTNNLKDNKPDTAGNMLVECSGQYFNNSFGAVHNALVVKYRYKISGAEWAGTESEWHNMTVDLSGDTYTATAELAGLNYQENYIFETKATDLLMAVSSGENSLKSLPVFHWGKDDFVHETPVSFNKGIAGPVDFTGDIRLKPEGANFGSRLYFGDSSYAFIAEDTDDKLTFKATKLDLSASNISLSSQTDIYGGLSLNGASIAFGSWAPALSGSAVSSYDTQQGWYMKLGSVVTIGFAIKATCKSGYTTTNITIAGVPFTPSCDAFGGGIAYNVYVASGMCFEAWGINTSGDITARIQPCNNTTAKNLSIGSTVCFPSGGGDITLSGTISFMTTD